MSVDLPPGTVLLGKYRVDRVLGRGGMGVVVAATHLQLAEQVAMKFLLPEVLGNHEVVQRFVREAQAAVRLKGEHVARVIDVGALPWGAPYMVMEFLDGGDLAALVHARGRLPAHEAVDYLLQACEALAEAHALGIVHRDIKPANFFVTRRPDGSVLLKVLDFGISKAPVTIDGGLTSTQAVMGTPSYMSPEQMRSARDVDGRTDIWALGVVLFECLTGRRPFEAETFSALCLRAAMDPMPPLGVPLPPGLEAIVGRCLEKNRDARFRTVSELAIALAPYAGDQRAASIVVERTSAILGIVPAPPVSAALPAVAAAPTTLGASAGAIGGTPSRPRRGLWIGAGLLVAGGVVAVVVATGPSGGPSTPAAPAAVEPASTPHVEPPAAQPEPKPEPKPVPEPEPAPAPAPPPMTQPDPPPEAAATPPVRPRPVEHDRKRTVKPRPATPGPVETKPPEPKTTPTKPRDPLDGRT